ncbi:MAG: glycosyltransferase family 4 protein [Planctomycetes bacterium]|nr:glycosyltransferase family 4 protein [Planctomycetota bacterium]
MKVAYLVNLYPAPSHSFILREILALERLGVTVQRFSIRPGSMPWQAAAEARELELTAVLLRGAADAPALLWATLLCLLTRPARFVQALRQLWACYRFADRTAVAHVAYLLEACRMVRAMAPGTDHIHAHFGTNSATVAMLASRLSGVPYSFTVHGWEEFDRAQGLGLREKIRHASFVAAITHHCRSQLLRYTEPTRWDRILVVRCGVDAQFLDGEPPPIAADAPFLWIGRLAPEKGFSILLDACRRLRAEGRTFRVRVVGGGDRVAEVEAELRRTGLGDAVELLGWRSGAEILELLDQSRGLVMSSLAEGLPVVIMEAFARRRPAIAPALTGIPELVITGRTGWLYSASDVSGLSSAMAACLEAPAAQLDELGANARSELLARHRIDAIAAELLAAFAAGPDGSPTDQSSGGSA